MTIRRRHWLTAFIIALVLHGSLILLLWEPAESGAANLGVGGMEISFGMAGGAPGTTEVPPPQKETVDAPETEPVEPVETPPVETVETAEVMEPVEESEPPEPVEVEAVEPPSAETVPVAEVKPKTEKAKVPKKPEPPKETQAVEPEPAPAPQPPKEIASTPPVKEVEPQAPSIAGSAGKSGTEKTSNTGSGKDKASGGRPGSSDSYFARLQAWLEQHKEYPSSARRRRHEGTAVLNFTMSRNGEVIEARVLRGTGYASLDEEVMNMIRRASPLPPFPDDFDDARLTLSVPVRFQLH